MHAAENLREQLACQVHRRLRHIGHLGGGDLLAEAARGRTDVPKIVDWYLGGRIKLDELITHRRPLVRINEGFGPMKRDHSIRSVMIC